MEVEIKSNKAERIYLGIEGMGVAIEMLAQRSPGTKLDTNLDKYVDERLLDELEKEGLFKKISGNG
jgi:hypothetical protein